VLLTHVRIIDATGAAPLEDQSILIENGKIVSIGATPPANSPAQIIDLSGRTVIPAWSACMTTSTTSPRRPKLPMDRPRPPLSCPK